MNIYLKLAFKWLFRFAIGLIIAGVVIFTWIRVHPPSLSILDPYIRQALQPLAPEYTVTYKDIRLAWPKGRLVPGINILDAQCLIHGDTLLARFPDTTVRLRLAGLFLGRVEPVEIWLSRPQVDLSHLTQSKQPSGPPAAAALGALNSPHFFDTLFGIAERHKAFKRLHAAEGRLVLPGESAPIAVDLPSVVLSMLHVQATPELILTAAYKVDGQASRLQTVIHAPPAKASDPGEVSESRINVTNLHPPLLAELAPDLALLRGLKFTTNLELLFRVDASGTVNNLRFEMDSGEGGTLFTRRCGRRPSPVEKITAKGWLKNGFTQLKLARLHIESRKTTIDATGTVDNLGKFDTISLDVRIDHLNPARAHEYWPRQVLPVTRNWIREHFKGGEIHDAVAKIRITPEDLAAPVLPKEAVDVTAPFSDVAMTYLGALEPIKDADGTARFTAHDITIEVASARNYDSIASEGRVLIGNFTEEPATIEIQAKARGPADDLRKVVDGLTGNTAYPVKITDGKAETRLSFQWPLSHFSEETFDYHAAAKIQGLEIADFKGYRWTQKTLLVSLDRNAIAVTGTDGEISSEAALEAPIPVKRVEAKGALSYRPAGVDVSAFSADLGGPVIALSGSLTAAAPYHRVKADATVDGLPFKSLQQYWPQGLAAPLREWIGTRVSGGTITHAGVRVDLDPAVSALDALPPGAVAVDAAFTGVQVDGFPPLPPVKAGQGRLTLSADTAQVRLDAGEIAQSRITTAQADIKGIQAGAPVMELQADIQGPASDLTDAAGKMLKQGPAARELPPPASGTAATRIRFSTPLRSKVSAADLQYTIASEVTDLAVNDVLGLNLTHGKAALTLDNGRFVMDGTIRSGETPVSVKWETTPDAVETIRLSAAVDPQHHADFRLPPLPFLTGTVQAEVDITMASGGAQMASRLDFADAAVDLKRWGWVKPAGTPAVLQSRATLTEGERLTVSELALTGEKLDVQGSGTATFGDSPAFAFQLDPVKAGKHRLAANLTRTGEKGFRADLTGKRFDAAGLLVKKASSTAPPESQTAAPAEEAVPEKTTPQEATRPKTVITFDLDEALLANGVTLAQPKGRIILEGDKIRSALIDGTLGKEAPLHVAVTRQKEPEKILIQTGDAGALLKGMDISQHIQGGELVFDGRCEDLLPTRHPVSGTVEIRDFLLVNAPGLVKVLSMASFVGALGQLQHGGIGFNTLTGVLAFEDNIITLRSGRMEGVSLAMTSEGIYDIQNQTLDVKGIVIPVNILNQMLDMIPVFGKMIVGQGIIATDYSLKGPLDNPEARIKPLTTLSVGFLRNVFKGFDIKAPENSEAEPAVKAGEPFK